MKKLLLLSVCALLQVGAATAQVNETYEGAVFTAMSSNGEWLLEDVNGDVRLYNRTTGEWKEFNSSEDLLTTYHTGLGRCITDDGMFVGSVHYDASFYKDGTWTSLPQSQGQGMGMNGCNAVTPDGKRICGILGNTDLSMEGEDAIYAIPAVWTMQDDGTWTEEILPYPEKDFTNRAPQYIVADDISADGKIIVGNVRDCLGLENTLIIWRQAADGTWSYTEPLTELVYDAEKAKDIPDYPEPLVYPEGKDYMTEDQYNQYLADYEYWNEMLNLYYMGTITWEEVPPCPEEWQYIDDEHRSQWVADSTAYYDNQDAYWEELSKWNEKFNAALTGESFNFNSVDISENGKWLAACTRSGKAVILNLEDNTSRVVETSEMLTTGVTDYGMVVVCSPLSLGYTRVPYVLLPGSDDPISFKEWLATMGLESVITKSFTGTVTCNAKGTKFCGYISPFDDGDPCSYYVDLGDVDPSGINAAAASTDNVIRREYFSLDGQRIAAPSKGIYIEKTVTTNGTTSRKCVK